MPLTCDLNLYCRCAGLRIKEVKDVYEGEVASLTPVESETALAGCVLIFHIGVRFLEVAERCRVECGV